MRMEVQDLKWFAAKRHSFELPNADRHFAIDTPGSAPSGIFCVDATAQSCAETFARYPPCADVRAIPFLTRPAAVRDPAALGLAADPV